MTVRVQRCNGEKGEETTTLSYELSRHSMDNRLPSTIPTHMSSFFDCYGVKRENEVSNDHVQLHHFYSIN